MGETIETESARQATRALFSCIIIKKVECCFGLALRISPKIDRYYNHMQGRLHHIVPFLCMGIQSLSFFMLPCTIFSPHVPPFDRGSEYGGQCEENGSRPVWIFAVVRQYGLRDTEWGRKKRAARGVSSEF